MITISYNIQPDYIDNIDEFVPFFEQFDKLEEHIEVEPYHTGIWDSVPMTREEAREYNNIVMGKLQEKGYDKYFFMDAYDHDTENWLEEL